MPFSTEDALVSHALQQALLLRALASHLTEYPHLQPPHNFDDHGTTLQLTGGATELLDWADSLTSVRLTVQNIADEAFVYAEGVLFRYEITVWAVVPGLLEVLGERYPSGRYNLAFEVLRAFAAGAAV